MKVVVIVTSIAAAELIIAIAVGRCMSGTGPIE